MYGKIELLYIIYYKSLINFLKHILLKITKSVNEFIKFWKMNWKKVIIQYSTEFSTIMNNIPYYIIH